VALAVLSSQLSLYCFVLIGTLSVWPSIITWISSVLLSILVRVLRASIPLGSTTSLPDLNSGYKKTSITALRSNWQLVIYVSKLLAANSSQALFLTFFITPLKKLVFSKMH